MRRKRPTAIERLLEIMARLRGPGGCPWDRKQTHHSLRFYAVEEVYELLDAIESGDDTALLEELGDLLLQVVFHAQLAQERGVFDFDAVAQRIAEKLIHRHPHVFGDANVRTAEQVLAQWEELKRKEKQGTRHQRDSVFDGIPRHLPALMRASELLKKARKAGLWNGQVAGAQGRGIGIGTGRWTARRLGRTLWELVALAQARGWSAEALLREESKRREQAWRRQERRNAGRSVPRVNSGSGRHARSRGAAASGARARPG